METTFVPVCFHPTSVVLIDDEPRFLEATAIKIGKYMAVKNFNDPTEALKFLNEDYKFEPFTKKCLVRTEDEKYDHRSIDVNIQLILQELYNPQRFEQISVVIVDYAMPLMNGGEVCRQLQKFPFKIILLTGEADEKVAIELFNQGLIHKYIRKDTANLMNNVLMAIQELQYKYFLDLSAVIIDSLINNQTAMSSCLNDPVFVDFFNKFCKKQSFAEYYLIDEKGSFLFLDSIGNPSLLLVKDEEQMRGDAFEAEMSDIEVPAEILTSLRRREKLLYLYSQEDFIKNPSEWKPYIHPAQKIEGKTTYYYTFINRPQPYNFHLENIRSFRAFLESQ